jgi:hypothetical protein
MSAAAGAKKAAASYWRLAGLTYLDALNASTSALRRCVCSSPRGSAPGELRVRSRGAVPRQRLRAEAFRALRGAGCVSAGRREARTAVLVSSAVLLCARPSPSRCPRVPCRLFSLAAHTAAARPATAHPLVAPLCAQRAEGARTVRGHGQVGLPLPRVWVRRGQGVGTEGGRQRPVDAQGRQVGGAQASPAHAMVARAPRGQLFPCLKRARARARACAR